MSLPRRHQVNSEEIRWAAVVGLITRERLEQQLKVRELERLRAWFGDYENDPPDVDGCLAMLDRMRTSEIELIARAHRAGERPDAPTLVDARIVYPAELGGPGKWFPCVCPKCEWRGLSRDSVCRCNGEDWDDPQCPRCGTVLEDDPLAEFSAAPGVVEGKGRIP